MHRRRTTSRPTWSGDAIETVIGAARAIACRAVSSASTFVQGNAAVPSRHVVILLCAAVTAAPLAAPAAALPHFTQPNAIWNADVSNATLRSNSALMMTHLESIATTRRGSPCQNAGTNSGCWGGDGGATSNINFQMDLTNYALHADAGTPTAAVVAWPGDIANPDDPYYYVDCDDPGAQTQFPVPAGGGAEGTDPPDYTCDASNNDCHLLVVNDATHVLWESYNTSYLDGGGLHTHCAVHWYLDRVYPRYGRGEHCTSADGAGFPIAPLLFNADEVWAAAQVQGDLGHAIRFILGNSRMMNDRYVHPASHGTTATSDSDLVNGVPYGSRLRLKLTFNVAGFSANENVRVLLRTLQKYGMFLSDGGSIPLTGEDDTFDTHKWADLGIDTHSLFGINPTDFEVIEAGTPMTVTYDCVRTPDDFVFIDGYDF
jgi:serine/threonine-protein kinase